MSVVGLEVRSRAPFAQGHRFGSTGTYERIDGVLRYAVDPADPLNAGIVDLDVAERGDDGLVHFAADIRLLQPIEPGKSNGRLLLEVPNRGRKGAPGRFNRPAPAGAPTFDSGGIAVGDGLLFNQGWTIAWIGWQWDVIRDQAPHGLVGFDPPQALGPDGKPIQGQVMLEWQPDAPQADKLLADRIHKPYPAADVHEAGATLYERAYPAAPRREIPRTRWRFARDSGTTPIEDDTHVWMEGGFQPGVIYDLVYTTSICPVVGTGLLALRDGVSFLRHGTDGEGNPAAGRLHHTIGFGASQCGRLLREFLYQGLNVDEQRRQMFDGLLIHVAGSRRGEFNHRYAQPSAITIPSFGHQPPAGFEGLLLRQRERGGVPKIFATNSSSEYWNREASLLHTDEHGTRDLEPPEHVRVYHFAGTKHGPGMLRPTEGEAPEPPLPGGRQYPNVVDFGPLMRAALFNMDRWIAEGAAPPSNRHPLLDDGTASPPADVLGSFHRIPSVVVPDPDRLYWRHHLDLRPDAGRGVGHFPAEEGDRFTWYVSAVDADGNERAGIRLPDVAVPVATHTGWFPRRPAEGGAGQNVDMKGSTIPFAPDEATRRQWDDPRASIEERYSVRDAYAVKARACAEELMEQGFLLREDVGTVVQNALDRYDAFVKR